MTIETKALTLIRTKLQRPRLPGDLIPRRRLLDRLHAGSDRKLTLISAMAGAGKTTLLAQWLKECPKPSAWLSLDEHDNDPIVFLSYLCTAIGSLFPGACRSVLDLLSAPQPPPARVLMAAIINEADELIAGSSRSLAGPSRTGTPTTAPSQKGFALALDDYHTISAPEVHEIVSGMVEHLPQGMHLALATRTDPPLPLAGWRARREMTEVRSADLRFTPEEAQVLLQQTTGKNLNPEMIRLLEEKTEGWAVGLRLAALSMRARPDDTGFAQDYAGISSDLIVEYLANEVLARQSPQIQDFVLRTSLMDRFCAPLCEALTEIPADRSQEIIDWIGRANLFLVPLDEEGRWYRYHHLFRDLLRPRLRQRHNASAVSELHARAGAWYAENELIDEALHHLLAAGNETAVAKLVARHRTEMLNQARWSRLSGWVRQLSPDVIEQHPDLRMLRTWLLYHETRYAEIPASLQRLEAALAQAPLTPSTIEHLRGEMAALHSLMAYFAGDVKTTIFHAQESLEKTRPDLWIVRSLARLTLAGALQMRGDLHDAYAAIYDGFVQEEVSNPAFKATLLLTACNIHWIAADLQGLAQVASQCIALSQGAHSPEILNYGHYHLGCARYHHNDLAGAERHFSAVWQQPYLNYGDCFIYGACGLALTHQAQGRPEEARAVAESAVAFMLETGNTTLLPEAQAFQVEIALMQGQVAAARQWADLLDAAPSLSPVYGFFSPVLTLVKARLAQDTPDSRGQAADLLGRFRAFCESSHNIRFSIETLALQALLYHAEGDEPAALVALEQAIALAEPGGFLRLFVDLGPPLGRLLHRLHRQGVAVDYVNRLLMTFETTAPSTELRAGERRQKMQAPPPSIAHRRTGLFEHLTPRELEVLQLLGRHLTNREIAEELVVSPSTVKTHTLNIYRKLKVNKRRQAVARARELDLLPPSVR